MPDKLSWYSIDSNLDITDNPPVSFEEAVEIAKKYYANAGKTYESGEEGISQTTFGIEYDEKNFIELCVNGVNEISCRFEIHQPWPGVEGLPWWKKLAAPGAAFHRDVTLVSFEEMVAKIREFYTTPLHDIRLSYLRR